MDAHPARNSYRSPHGTEFAGGKAIAEYLDLFCIPPICNTLQLPPQPINVVEEIKQGQELRECVVRNVYKRRRNSNKTQKNQKDDSSLTRNQRHLLRKGRERLDVRVPRVLLQVKSQPLPLKRERIRFFVAVEADPEDALIPKTWPFSSFQASSSVW